MKKADWPAWQNKTERLNAAITLTRGMVVQDVWGATGVVVQIVEGRNADEHGSIAVWLSNKFNHGDTNCEHYPHFGWKRVLRVLEYHDGDDPHAN